jgi:hypothetical protein
VFTTNHTRLCWGSLLGAVRENQRPFQAIPWEHDADLCVLNNDLERARQALQKTDLPLSPDVGSDTIQVVIPAMHAHIARIYIDFFAADPDQADPNTLVMTQGSLEPVSFPKDDVFPLKRVSS